MKKVFLVAGLGLAGFGLYRYFKYQVDLALNYSYNLKDIKIEKIEGENVTISVSILIENKSNFSIEVTGYDLDLFFKSVKFANTKSNKSIKINPKQSFEVKATGVLNTSSIKQSIVPFIQDVVNRKPIDIQVSGFVRIIFMRFPSTIKFDKENINYSVDLLKEYNLDTRFEKLKSKYPKLFAIFNN